jgi:hypothetical protein
VIIYLDESGDLGFSFKEGKKPSKYFVTTLLVCHSDKASKAIKSAVTKTLRNKINRNPKKMIYELKGTNTTYANRCYFYKEVLAEKEWELYSLVLDKYALSHLLTEPPNKHRIYNYLAREILQHVNFSLCNHRITLVVDRSKGVKKREEFDRYLFNHLESLLPLSVSLHINHDRSHLNKGIQAVDLFCWGIFRKYEHNDLDWYNVFADKIKFELTSGIKKDGP